MTQIGENFTVLQGPNRGVPIRQERRAITPRPVEYCRDRPINHPDYSDGRLFLARERVSYNIKEGYHVIDGFMYPDAFLQSTTSASHDVILKVPFVNAAKVFFRAKNNMLEEDPVDVDPFDYSPEERTGHTPSPRHVFRDTDLPTKHDFKPVDFVFLIPNPKPKPKTQAQNQAKFSIAIHVGPLVTKEDVTWFLKHVRFLIVKVDEKMVKSVAFSYLRAKPGLVAPAESDLTREGLTKLITEYRDDLERAYQDRITTNPNFENEVIAQGYASDPIYEYIPGLPYYPVDPEPPVPATAASDKNETSNPKRQKSYLMSNFSSPLLVYGLLIIVSGVAT